MELGALNAELKLGGLEVGLDDDSSSLKETTSEVELEAEVVGLELSKVVRGNEGAVVMEGALVERRLGLPFLGT